MIKSAIDEPIWSICSGAQGFLPGLFIAWFVATQLSTYFLMPKSFRMYSSWLRWTVTFLPLPVFTKKISVADRREATNFMNVAYAGFIFLVAMQLVTASCLLQIFMIRYPEQYFAIKDFLVGK